VDRDLCLGELCLLACCHRSTSRWKTTRASSCRSRLPGGHTTVPVALPRLRGLESREVHLGASGRGE
jgi:hypothetical protein